VNQQQATYAKLALVFLVMLGGFVLVGMGKLDATSMFGQTATLIGSLVIALGISGGASAMAGNAGGASAMRAMLRSPLIRPDADAPPKPPSSGGPLLVLLLVGCSLAAALRLLPACSSIPSQLPPGIVTGIDVAKCVLRVYGDDTAAHKTWAQILADEAMTCGADELTATGLLAEHRRAEELEHGPSADAGVAEGGAP
jgi:hypothetical protein